MSEYRKSVLTAASKLKKLQAEIAKIKDSGLDQKKQKQLQQEATKKIKEELDQELRFMKKFSEVLYIKSIKDAEKVRRGKSADANDRLFHQQRAAMGLRGLEPEDALEEYNNMIYGMTEEDKKHKWIYEDTLRAAVRDPDYKHEVEQTLSKHRTEEEQAALQEARSNQTMISHDKTLRGLLQMDFDEITRTGSASNYDYASFLDEMEKNARGQETDLGSLKSAEEAIKEVFGSGKVFKDSPAADGE